MSACAPLAGGAALLGLVAIGAATSSCYDYLDVTVFDADGRQTCAATVTAIKGSSHFELTSCYYTPLTDGRWTLRASQQGFSDSLSTVVVDHEHDCTRQVQSVELTLNRAGSAPVARPLLPTPPAAPSVAAPSVAAPATAAPASPSAPDGAGLPASGSENVSPPSFAGQAGRSETSP